MAGEHDRSPWVRRAARIAKAGQGSPRLGGLLPLERQVSKLAKSRKYKSVFIRPETVKNNSGPSNNAWGRRSHGPRW
jgi:hypothetical protein